jgi:hypothetical protein
MRVAPLRDVRIRGRRRARRRLWPKTAAFCLFFRKDGRNEVTFALVRIRHGEMPRSMDGPTREVA